MDPINIISKYYAPKSKLFDIVVNHGRQVAKKALNAAENVSHLDCDKKFIQEAAMLHDIGKTREFEYIQSPLKMFNKIFYDDVDRSMSESTFEHLDLSHLKDTYVKVIVKNKEK